MPVAAMISVKLGFLATSPQPTSHPSENHECPSVLQVVANQFHIVSQATRLHTLAGTVERLRKPGRKVCVVASMTRIRDEVHEGPHCSIPNESLPNSRDVAPRLFREFLIK
jgi:hypothetical protein